MTALPLRPARRVGLLVTWALATVGGLIVASTTKIGPVVLAITENHGVHSGDLVGFALCYGAALLASLVIRPHRPRPAADAPRAGPVSGPPPSWAPPPTAQWPPPRDPWSQGRGSRPARTAGAGSGAGFSAGFSSADADTHRLRRHAPRRPFRPDDEPTRPIRLGHPSPDSPYGRRAG